MPHVPPPNRNRSGFTLIELLAVIGLIVLLAAVTIPAFSALVQGTGVKAAAAQVRGAMTQARTHAIMNNTVTDFIVMTLAQPVGATLNPPILAPTNFTPAQAAERAPDFVFRGYAVYDRVNHRYVKPWTKLPNGVVFDTTETYFKGYQGKSANFLDPSSHNSNAAPGSSSKYRYYVPKEPSGGDGPQLIRYCPSIRFRPNARATSPMSKYNGNGSDGAGNTWNSADRVAVVMAEGSVRLPISATGFINTSLLGPNTLIINSNNPNSKSSKSAVYVYHYNGRTEIEYK